MLSRAVASFALALAAVSANAQTCGVYSIFYGWPFQAPSPAPTNQLGVLESAFISQVTADSRYSVTVTGTTCPPAQWNLGCNITFHTNYTPNPSIPGGSGNSPLSYDQTYLMETASNGACPVNPPTCAAKAGQTAVIATGAAMHGAVEAQDGCEYTITDGVSLAVSGGGSTLQTGVADGQGGTPGSLPVSATAGGGVDTNACITNSQGTTCLDLRPDGHNCGIFNGDAVCVAAVPNNSCVSYASGGVACTTGGPGQAATTPPAPNNGTPGVPATATGTVTAPSGNVTNYYSAGAVKGSTVGVASVGNPVGTGGVGGTGTGNTPSGPTSADCAFQGNCNPGDLPAMPTVNDVQTSTTNYMTAINNAPIVHAFANISAAIPSGQCPAPSFGLWGKTYTWDAPCIVFDQISAVLSAICLVCYTVLGAKILMSA